jgi:TonB family protein
MLACLRVYREVGFEGMIMPDHVPNIAIPEGSRVAFAYTFVIVRVLVSQTGHVSLVNVLRRSKTGVALDDAVVAAVKQWTFSPARKRGEAVSCWYHVGVPIQRAG